MINSVDETDFLHYIKIYKNFQVRINQAKRLNITPSLDEKIQLYNMTEEVLWADLDRYRTLIILDSCEFKT